ncbi:MAG: hypothetical protein OEL83_03565 [Desulforhopalus sp.]|nr:hypothetical protein [Desulforhopalus sp.]
MRYSISLLILLVFSGCGYKKPANPDNILAVDKLGSPINPKSGEEFTGKEELNRHVQRLLPESKKRILIFIHGGLNTDDAAIQRSNDWASPIMHDGYWPIFVQWPSGFFSTFKEHILYLRQGEYATWTGPLTSPFILFEDVGRGIIRAPMVWWYQGRDFTKSIAFGNLPSERDALRTNQLLAVEQPTRFAEIPSVVNSQGQLLHEQGISERFGKGLKSLFQFHLGLLTAPIFDSFGTGAWDDMKRRTYQALAKTWVENPEFQSIDTYTKEREGGLTAFFDALSKRQQRDEDLEIVLIGHSMGTIIANSILKKWPEINYDRIVYLAAACSIADFQGSVVPHLKKNNKTRFFNLMLHPLAENQEAHMIGFGGTGTLLNQIDNIYENAVSMSQRTLGKWENTMNGIQFFDIPGIRQQIYLRTMPLGNGYLTTHGSFAEAYDNTVVGQFWQERFGIPSNNKP